MLTKDFRAWVKRCMDFVDEHGLLEKKTYCDEVIWTMEEGAERRLTPEENAGATALIQTLAPHKRESLG